MTAATGPSWPAPSGRRRRGPGAGRVGRAQEPDPRRAPRAGASIARRASRADASAALEVALVAPVVGVLVVGVLGLTTVVVDQLTAERTARAAARAVAVAGSLGDARTSLPAGAHLAVDRTRRQVVVTVTVPGTVGPLPYEVGATATAVLEPALP